MTVAEDSSSFQREVPGLFFFIGVRSADVPLGRAVPNHSPLFDTDERALRDGVRAMANLVVRLPEHPITPHRGKYPCWSFC